MSALDRRFLISDELWTQIRPAPARFRAPITLGLLLVIAATLALAQMGFFHPAVGATFEEAAAHGNRLTVVLSVYDRKPLPARVTGFRAAQSGARIVSSRQSAALSASPDVPAPDGTRATPFTVGHGPVPVVTVVYLLDCSKLRPPLRLAIGTRNLFGNHTNTVELTDLTATALAQACPATGLAGPANIGSDS